MAFSLIWRTRSRVRSKVSPILPGSWGAGSQAKIQTNHVGFPWRQGLQGALNFRAKRFVQQATVWVRGFPATQYIVEIGILAFHQRASMDTWRPEFSWTPSRHWWSCPTLGNFFHRRWTLVGLLQERISFIDLVDASNFVQRKTNNSGLLCQGLEYRLSDPPNGIEINFKPTGFVKTLRGFDKPLPGVDQIGKGQTLVLVLFCHRNNKTKVGFGQFFKHVGHPLLMRCS